MHSTAEAAEYNNQGHQGEQLSDGVPWLNKAFIIIIILL